MEVEQQKNGTIKITVNTTAEQGQTAKKDALSEMAPHINADGFRPGKAPLNVVEKNVRVDKLVEKTLGYLGDTIYHKAIEEKDLRPITQPSLSIPQLAKTKTEEPDFDQLLVQITQEGIELVLTTYTIPEIKLGDWQKKVQDIKPSTQKSKTTKIETATSVEDAKQKAKSKEEEPEAEEENSDQVLENQIIEVLVDQIKFELADGLVESETQKQLYQQIQLVQRLGMSYEDYLKSRNKTIEDVEKEIRTEAEKALRVRFILTRIVEENREYFSENPNGEEMFAFLKKIVTGEKLTKVKKDSNKPNDEHQHIH